MAERRDFLRSLAAFAATPGSRRSVGAQHAAPLPTPGVTGGPTDREYWLDVLQRLAQPVLTNLAQGRLRQRMPVEIAPAGNPERSEEHTSELQSPDQLVCRVLLEKKESGKPREAQ